MLKYLLKYLFIRGANPPGKSTDVLIIKIPSIINLY